MTLMFHLFGAFSEALEFACKEGFSYVLTIQNSIRGATTFGSVNSVSSSHEFSFVALRLIMPRYFTS